MLRRIDKVVAEIVQGGEPISNFPPRDVPAHRNRLTGFRPFLRSLKEGHANRPARTERANARSRSRRTHSVPGDRLRSNGQRRSISEVIREGSVAQRVGPVSWVRTEPFQRWLRAMNIRKYDVFVSVNAIASGRRARTRDAIGAVRHVFLDADHDGLALLSRVEARRDLPIPSYVL